MSAALSSLLLHAVALASAAPGEAAEPTPVDAAAAAAPPSADPALLAPPSPIR
jgi:hypothetical protein